VNDLFFDPQIYFIYVQNLIISLAFYEGMMGFQMVFVQGGCGIVQTAMGKYLGY
jgi:hypothetical protein